MTTTGNPSRKVTVVTDVTSRVPYAFPLNVVLVIDMVNVNEDIVSALRKATKDCADRGLIYASKWFVNLRLEIILLIVFALGLQNCCFPYQPSDGRLGHIQRTLRPRI